MTYEEAITLLKQGDEVGFQFLYDTTYKTCLYAIGEIVKDRMEAEDILQDAYMNAIKKIDTLKEPEKFPSWFRTIASRLAINRLKKNRRTITINSGEDETPESVMDKMVNEKFACNQITPEEAYECKESSRLLHELIDDLPEKQRQCIILFYMEEYSIKDIAKIYKCSENTVKSRLNYGKQKLEEKTLKLQQKGYVLWGVSPVYLITWLLKTDRVYKLKFIYDGASATSFSHALFLKLVNSGLITVVNSGMITATGGAINGGTIAGTTVKGTVSSVVKGGIHTAVGKIIAGTTIAVISGGLVTAAIVTNNKDKIENEPESEVTGNLISEDTTEEITTEAVTSEATTEEIADDGYFQMSEEDYAELICGGLSMQETGIMLECVCATNGNSNIVASEIDKVDYISTIITGYAEELSLEEYDEIDYQKVYSTDKINNMLEAVQIPLLTSDNYDYWLSDEWMQFYINSELIFESTDDGILIGDYFIGLPPYVSRVEIISAKYNDEEMRIIFKLYRHNQDLDEETICMYENYEEAILLKNDSDKYYFSEVHEYDDTINNETTDTYSSEALETWKETYKEILENDSEWGVDTYLFNYENSGIDMEYLNSNYGTVIEQYALIYSANEVIPYLVTKLTCEDSFSEYSQYYPGNDRYDYWCIYKYDENEDAITCFCDLVDPNYFYSDEYNRELLIYNNELFWYVYNRGETYISNLCIYDESGSLPDSVPDDEDFGQINLGFMRVCGVSNKKRHKKRHIFEIIIYISM